MLPAAAGTGTAPFGLTQAHEPDVGVLVGQGAEPVQPRSPTGTCLSSVASVSATQQVRHCCGSTKAHSVVLVPRKG